MIKVYTYVVADLIHTGHLKCLQQARALGDYLIVGVLTDEATATYKRQPIIPFEERLEMVRNVKCVDEAVRQSSLDPIKNIKKYKPDIITHSHGLDEKFPGNDVEGYMEKIGKKAIRTKYYQGQSTTMIIEKIKRAEV